MLKKALNCQIILFALMISPCYPSSTDNNKLELIRVSADVAREGIQSGTLYLEGNFLMQSHEWKLESEQAAVYGKHDKPDRVFLEGTPARFHITREDGQGWYTVEAEAAAIEYLQTSNTLELTGGAVLRLDDEVIKSSLIKYDIDRKRYWAGGADGVMVEVPAID